MRIIGLVAAVFILVGIAGAGAETHERLVVGMGSFPASLHPLIGGQASRDYLLGVARRKVTNLDAAGVTVCQLCTEVPSVWNGRVRIVELADGGRGMEATFTLRAGLKWGDGTDLTTRDILFGAEVARSTSPPVGVTGVVARDERSYVVMLDAVRFDVGEFEPAAAECRPRGGGFPGGEGPAGLCQQVGVQPGTGDGRAVEWAVCDDGVQGE